MRPRRPVSRWAQGGGRGSRRTPWPPPRRSSGLGWRPRFEPDIGPPPASSHLGSLRGAPFLPLPQVWSIDGAGRWGRAWRKHAQQTRCGAARAQVRPARAPLTPPGSGRREICHTPASGISPGGGRRGAPEGPRACPMYPSDSATLPDPPPPPQARLQRCGRGALGQRGGKVTRAPPAPAACKSSILTPMGHGVCRARRCRPAARCRTPTALGWREGPSGEGGGRGMSTRSSRASGRSPPAPSAAALAAAGCGSGVPRAPPVSAAPRPRCGKSCRPVRAVVGQGGT